MCVYVELHPIKAKGFLAKTWAQCMLHAMVRGKRHGILCCLITFAQAAPAQVI